MACSKEHTEKRAGMASVSSSAASNESGLCQVGYTYHGSPSDGAAINFQDSSQA